MFLSLAPLPPAAVVADTGAPAPADTQPKPPNPRAAQPERPSVATPASTVAPGYLEFETGAERDTPGDATHALEVPTNVKLGLAPRVQLTVQLPTHAATDTAFGLGDVAVGVKWRVLDGAPVVQDVALLPQVKFSSGGARGTGTTDASLLLINSYTLGPVSLDLNAGATWRTGDGTRAPKTSTLLTAATGTRVRGALSWEFEVYGYPGTRGPAGEAPIVAVLTGPTFTLRPELVLDVGTIVPVAGPQPHALYVGLVANLGRVFGPRPR